MEATLDLLVDYWHSVVEFIVYFICSISTVLGNILLCVFDYSLLIFPNLNLHVAIEYIYSCFYDYWLVFIYQCNLLLSSLHISDGFLLLKSYEDDGVLGILITILALFIVISFLRRYLYDMLVWLVKGATCVFNYFGSVFVPTDIKKVGYEPFICFEDVFKGKICHLLRGNVVVSAIQGRRRSMDDRFNFVENILQAPQYGPRVSLYEEPFPIFPGGSALLSLYGVFDGHGGRHTADFVHHVLPARILSELLRRLREELSNISSKEEEVILHNDNTCLNDKDSVDVSHVDEVLKEELDSNIDSNDKIYIDDSTQRGVSASRIELSQLEKDLRSFDPHHFVEASGGSQMNKGKSLRVDKIHEDYMQAIRKFSPPKIEIDCLSQYHTLPTVPKSSQGNEECVRGYEDMCDVALTNCLQCTEELFKKTIFSVDEESLERSRICSDISGTTAILALRHNDMLYVSNVGDSRALLCKGDGTALPLSIDHKPNLARERERIESSGGSVKFVGVWRVAGVLAISRALGNFLLKTNGWLSSEAEVLRFDLSVMKAKFLLLATDGLFDVFSNKEIVNILCSRADDEDHGARHLTNEAYRKGSTDNISILLVRL